MFFFYTYLCLIYLLILTLSIFRNGFVKTFWSLIGKAGKKTEVAIRRDGLSIFENLSVASLHKDCVIFCHSLDLWKTSVDAAKVDNNHGILRLRTIFDFVATWIPITLSVNYDAFVPISMSTPSSCENLPCWHNHSGVDSQRLIQESPTDIRSRQIPMLAFMRKRQAYLCPESDWLLGRSKIITWFTWALPLAVRTAYVWAVTGLPCIQLSWVFTCRLLLLLLHIQVNCCMHFGRPCYE